MKRFFSVLPALWLALTALPAGATEQGELLLAQAMNEQEIIEALKNPVDQTGLEALDRRTRGLRVVVDPSTPPPVSGVQFKVQFAFGSADLTDEAKGVLNELGSALSSTELSPYNFRVTGHTDAIGEDRFNLGLSEQRARAVENYLAANFGIERSRLESVGVGERVLLVPDNPAADENRRVEIMNIGTGS
ncbi:MAG: OmpA family protein [Inquilinus sp.]|nr:OmpA family protein [Inquilinus sp.]